MEYIDVAQKYSHIKYSRVEHIKSMKKFNGNIDISNAS